MAALFPARSEAHRPKRIDHHQLGFGAGFARRASRCPGCGAELLADQTACTSCGAFSCGACDELTTHNGGDGTLCYACITAIGVVP